MSKGFMKMESNQELEDELRPEYDFSKMNSGVRGKYVERYRTGTNIVLLDPVVAQAFPTSARLMKHFAYSCKLLKGRKPNNASEPTSQKRSLKVIG